jgi:nucleotide-binding universal stress UspA family protein
MKDILLHVPVEANAKPVTNYAIALAQQFGAHLTAAAVSFKPIAVGSPFEAVAASVITGALEAEENRTKAATATFEQAVRGAQLQWDSHLIYKDAETACSWFTDRALHYDLILCQQANPDALGAEGLLTETAMFSSGRPVLVIPYIQRAAPSYDRIAVCWNGSANAARAVHDAMPFLKKAKKIDILHATESSSSDEIFTPAYIATHLARHSLKVNVEILASPDLTPADAVLNFIADNGTKFLVMGAYGHSRLREFILGGMTKDMLAMMTVPTLLAH